MEASGTSGEKAQMNGVLNLSVLDGWWLEGYVKGAGWALTEKRTYENQAHQDQLDAATIYHILENEIIPMYYARNTKGFSPEWIETIKNSVTKITPRFTMKRQLDDYYNKFYIKLAKRAAMLKADDFKRAKELVAWKENLVSHWDEIEVLQTEGIEQSMNPQVGEKHTLRVVIDTHNLNDRGIGIELVAVRRDEQNQDKLYEVEELKLVKAEGSRLTFEDVYQLDYSGSLKYAFRMFPKNEDLPHRQDLCYVRWI
jgi:starch phosphorylase